MLMPLLTKQSTMQLSSYRKAEFSNIQISLQLRQMKIHSKGWWFRHYVLCNQSSFSDTIFYIQIASYWFLAFFIDRLVEELKRHHLVVTGEPCPPAEANTEPATSTSEESSSAALGEGNNCDSSRESASSSSPNRKTRSGTAHKLKSESAFDILQKKFPVTITGSKPHRSLLEVDDVSWRKAYKYWLHGQQKLRQEYVRCEYILSILLHIKKQIQIQSCQLLYSWLTKLVFFTAKFPWRQPSTKSLQKLIKNQGWDGTTNTMQLLRRWIPSGSGENIMDCTAIQKLEKNQRWKGLRTQQSEGQGTSVMAKRKFRVGEVVCDYHAAVVTVSDGKEDSRCDCHTKQPPGKLIKYSENNSNVTPKHCPLVLNGEKMHVTLFLATKIISTDEEVLLPLSFKGTLWLTLKAYRASAFRDTYDMSLFGEMFHMCFC